MINIFLNTESSYSDKYLIFINKYKDILLKHLLSRQMFNVCALYDDNKPVNDRNILISDLFINIRFINNDLNNITIYCSNSLNKISNELKLSILSSRVVPRQVDIVIDSVNNTLNENEIIIEYNINENNINWLFNDIVLNILLEKISNTLVDCSNLITSNNYIFVNSNTKAVDLFTNDLQANIEKIVPLIKKYQEGTGLLTSLSLGQFVYETACGTSELLLNANNCFGMKIFISNNNWYGSVWNNDSYTKTTIEACDFGAVKNEVAQFRKYDDIESSIVDHCSYLLNARSTYGYRYPNINKCKDYKEACNLLSNGGYSTFSDYGDNVAKRIEEYNLVKYDD